MQTGMNQKQLRRIESVTANYFFWQGLRWVPLGVALLLAILIRAAQPVITVLLMAVALALSGAAGRYYQRTFGNVRAIPGRHVRRDRWKWFFVYPLMAASLIIDGRMPSAFFVTGPVWGAAIVAYWNSTGRGRLHYLVIAAIVAASGFAPALGMIEPGKPMLNAFFVLLGVVYVIGGVLDHYELVRILGPLPEDHDAGTV